MSFCINTEFLLKDSPIIIQKDNLIDIVPIEDIFRTEKHKYEGILDNYKNCDIWNGVNWSQIIDGKCLQDSKSQCVAIQTRKSVLEVANIAVAPVVGDTVDEICYPEHKCYLNSDLNLARFIGFIVAEGYIAPDGGICITGKDRGILDIYSHLLCDQYGWGYRLESFSSGYSKDSIISRSIIRNDSNFGKWLRSEIYTLRSREKRVPKFILNSSIDVKKSFFEGYYLGDGRKAGHEKYEYKGFTTKSATLALGVIYLLQTFSSQVAKCKLDYRGDNKKYFYTQFDCGYATNKGASRRKNKNEIIKMINTKNSDGWLYLLKTNNNIFASGANLIKITGGLKA